MTPALLFGILSSVFVVLGWYSIRSAGRSFDASCPECLA